MFYSKPWLKRKILLFNYYQLTIRGVLGIDVVNNPFEIVYIHPNKIQYVVDNALISNAKYIKDALRLPAVGLVRSGDWDKRGPQIDDVASIVAIKERFSEGKRWQDTNFYNMICNTIMVKGRRMWNCSTVEEFEERLIWLEDLYENIKHNGYKSNRLINDINNWHDEIRVCVSRHGELLFVDGRHRLGIAKVLNLDLVPVIVTMWHRDYVDNYKRKHGANSITPKQLIIK